MSDSADEILPDDHGGYLSTGANSETPTMQQSSPTMQQSSPTMQQPAPAMQPVDILPELGTSNPHSLAEVSFIAFHTEGSK